MANTKLSESNLIMGESKLCSEKIDTYKEDF